jgi:hypothetical protein
MDKIEHIIFTKSENSETALRNNQDRGVVLHTMGDTLYVCKGSTLNYRKGGLPTEWHNLDVWKVERIGGRFNGTGIAEYVTDPFEHSQVSVDLMKRVRDTIQYGRDNGRKKRAEAAPNN